MTTVVAALIQQNGLLLICQRRRTDAFPLRWEFPGGKVKHGESTAAALTRAAHGTSRTRRCVPRHRSRDPSWAASLKKTGHMKSGPAGVTRKTPPLTESFS